MTDLIVGAGEHPCVILADELGRSTTPLRNVHAIARAKPAQKLDLVNALRQHGEIVEAGKNILRALRAHHCARKASIR